MKIGTFLWGIVTSLCGIIAILQGTSAQIDTSTLIVVLLLIFAGACTIAALVPARRSAEATDMSAHTVQSGEGTHYSGTTEDYRAAQNFETSPSASQTEWLEVEPPTDPNNEN
ncbi:hypothetical protein SAMN04489737_0955 [Arcanobacterium phocae]|uniref:Uncharacterized protein n=1 Tax=Arcanobacterium phocae TaxID=131112 RepID=A0A1H2LF42_9ACTO|nr:hypothetical protein [Arcanobacterium phocae]SDU79647.1 hypothetical protein SAMN04489737_0955 [Arcanobacterium phocae]